MNDKNLSILTSKCFLVIALDSFQMKVQVAVLLIDANCRPCESAWAHLTLIYEALWSSRTRHLKYELKFFSI